MALHYLDTSGLLKHYIPERGSAWTDLLLASEAATMSELTIVEFASAIGRRAREGSISATESDRLLAKFRIELRGFDLIEVSRTILEEAARLLNEGGPLTRLRSLDAIHLASAVSTFAEARRAGVAVGSFVTSDLALLRAAAAIGLLAVNPEERP